MKLSLARAAEFMQATGDFDPDAVASGYSIDSRTLQPGELFFAVRGERLDGHDFVEAALAKGAVGAVVRKDQLARYPVKASLLAATIHSSLCSTWGRPCAGFGAGRSLRLLDRRERPRPRKRSRTS